MMDPKWHKFSCIFPGSSNVGFQIQPFVNILQLVEQFFAGVQFSGQWARPLLPNCQPVRIQKPILLPNRIAFASPHNKCTTTWKYANRVNVTTHTFDIGGKRAPHKRLIIFGTIQSATQSLVCVLLFMCALLCVSVSWGVCVSVLEESRQTGAVGKPLEASGTIVRSLLTCVCLRVYFCRLLLVCTSLSISLDFYFYSCRRHTPRRAQPSFVISSHFAPRRVLRHAIRCFYIQNNRRFHENFDWKFKVQTWTSSLSIWCDIKLSSQW